MKKILITGAPRSGTTFLGEMLNLSNKVLYVWEPFNSNFREGLKYYYPYWGKSSSNRKKNYLLNVIMETIALKNLKGSIRNSRNDTYLESLIKNAGINRTRIKYFITKLKAKVFSHDFLLIKDPIAIFLSELLIQEFDFEVIICVRNPGSIIKSRLNLCWDFNFDWWLTQDDLKQEILSPHLKKISLSYDDKIAKAAIHWNIIYEYAHSLKKKYPNKVKISLQEDLIENPIEKIGSIYNSLGLEYKQNHIKKIKKYTNGKNEIIQKENVSKIKKRNLKTINDFEKAFSKDQIRIINEITNKTASYYY